MPPQARLGDKAFIAADAHGCVACPHAATGPAVAGSPNVIVNGRPAIRVDDPGIHSACCSGNTWNAKTGSTSVFINGKAAHRLGDIVSHCGGAGKCIEGSENVIVGDLTIINKSNSSNARSWIKICLCDAMGTSVANVDYIITLPNGELRKGKLDTAGEAFVADIVPGTCEVEFPGLVTMTVTS